MARKAIQAAGGIVVRGGARPRIAVVQRSKDDRWVLPRGKLKRDENPRAGARREAVEETGHRVQLHEFLGAITYTVRGQPKVVQFWRMQAAANPSRDLTKDIAAVEWLTLAAAVRRLSFSLEKLFLLNVGRRALKRGKHSVRRKARRKTRRKTRAQAATKKPQRRTAGKSRSKSHTRKSRAAKSRAAKSPAGKSHASKSHASKRRPRAIKIRARVRKSRTVVHKIAAHKKVPHKPVAHPPAVHTTAARVERRTMLQRMLGRLGR